MKTDSLVIALAAAILFAPELYSGSGMDSNNGQGAGQRQEETTGGQQFDKDRKEKGAEEEVSAQKGQEKVKKTPSRKRPRLKFYDQPKCAC